MRARVLALGPEDGFTKFSSNSDMSAADLHDVDIGHQHDSQYVSCSAVLEEASKCLPSDDNEDIDPETDTAPVCFWQVKLQHLED